MPDINFVIPDVGLILNDLIAQFEEAYGQTFYPGDERRIFLDQLAQVIAGLKLNINQSAKENLLRYASGDVLDAMGEFFNTPRLPARKAKVTLRFTLSSAQALPVTIPAGTRVTPDGLLYFATTQALSVPIGQTQGDVAAEAAEGGAGYNGFAPGQIKNLVDLIPYVASVSNTNTSQNGDDIETDANYRTRIQLAPESYSVAGPEGAYIYWAKSADVNISDVDVQSPSPGVVQVTVLMFGGLMPSGDVLDTVEAALASKERRPLTDNVQVAAPTEDSYNITLTYYISADRLAEEASIRTAIEGVGGTLDQYKSWQESKLGRAVNPDYLKQLMLNAGACRADIAAPVYIAIDRDHVAKAGTTTMNYGGMI